MKMHIITATSELASGEALPLENLKVIGGKNAGISQIRDEYFNSPVSDPEKALPRFNVTISRGHTSIANHAKVEVVFDGATRFFAMLMNNLRYYDTTERSGRFTEMVGNTEEQCALYDKWNALFKERIMELHPDFNDSFLQRQVANAGYLGVVIKNGEIESAPVCGDDWLEQIKDCLQKAKQMKSLPVNTRSQENARYVLSIFTKSTTFGYTTSIDQWNFIYDWCCRYLDQFYRDNDGRWLRRVGGKSFDATWFEQQVIADLMELKSFIKENLYIPDLRDHKKRCFNLFTNLFENAGKVGSRAMDRFSDADTHLGYAYSISYKGSFILLSHLHRHRTLKYTARLPRVEDMEFFVPEFIRDTPLEAKWLDDLWEIAPTYPQGALLEIFECGTLDDFALKATERLCGCAMWETMNNVRGIATLFAHRYRSGNVTPLEKAIIEKFYDSQNEKLMTKATMTDGCHEGCYFGCENALSRIV